MAVTWDWLVKKNFRLNDANLHPAVRQKAWDVIFELWQQGIYVLITQGYRSIAEQNDLYAQGRTKPGKIVTNARGGQSYHNYGLAIDFVLYTKDGKDVTWDDSSAEWKQVVRVFKSKEFAWGGDFRTFKDTPHFEMTFGYTYSQLQNGKGPVRPATVVVIPEPAKAVSSAVLNQESTCTIIVNGAKLDARGIMRDNLSYLPVRAVGNATGVTVGFENGKALLGKGVLQTTILIGDSGYAHTREIADVLGYKVDWDGKTQTVTLTKGAR
ncbi:peptidoglycan L-alanyl-D-glutamate endopeptidase CwlK [Aneurinibacillus soli]|uniref:Peptidoglycan L-alanyl-D-glutamate endopeptidase CwlK n=1 Tax=Aneurinibacillus soli TaxID=1500254 RepID=A0A0U5BBY1_9BACL|nr:M15 family metallopeptidase [Aneurinibacillus soli]PYE64288.1 peptidoglycan L-alanyl-D-glutamate endopeptidase CwlK [Aneurinibacillus soli]BAU28237.1 Peptidoglycan L-alanyl-D-glutamate endopeptidase CwlK precursor [Aneurinibacillus soli]